MYIDLKYKDETIKSLSAVIRGKDREFIGVEGVRNGMRFFIARGNVIVLKFPCVLYPYFEAGDILRVTKKGNIKLARNKKRDVIFGQVLACDEDGFCKVELL